MLYSIDTKKLKTLIPKLTKEFSNAKPYKHIVIKNFLKRNVAEALLKQFPSIEMMHHSSMMAGIAEKKNQLSDTKKMGEEFKKVFNDINSKEFTKILSDISGVTPLRSDDKFVGGGLHQGENGSFLDIHADFNKHPKSGRFRRLNIIVYLNKNWKPSYGGLLEMWSRDMKKCVRKLSPDFNTCLIFATDRYCYHGYKKMKLPKGVTRKSIAAYYYSNHPSEGESTEYHNTLFQARPKEIKNKILYNFLNSNGLQKFRAQVRKLVPYNR